MPVCEALCTKVHCDDLERRLTLVENEIDAIKGAIEDLERRVEAVEDKVEENKKQIERLFKRVAQLEADLMAHITLGIDVAHGGFRIDSVKVIVSHAVNSSNGSVKLFVRVDVNDKSGNDSTTFSVGVGDAMDCCDEILKLLRELQRDNDRDRDDNRDNNDNLEKIIKDFRKEFDKFTRSNPNKDDFKGVNKNIDAFEKDTNKKLKDINKDIDDLTKDTDTDLEKIIKTLTKLQENVVETFDEAKQAKLNTIIESSYDTGSIVDGVFEPSTVEVNSLEQALNVINSAATEIMEHGVDESESLLVQKIYTILGGDFWQISDDAVPNPRPYDPEQELVNQSNANYGTGDLLKSKEANIESLPELIKALLGVVFTRGGLVDYPATVPKLLTSTEDDTIKIANLHRLQTWQTIQLDALIGRFPIPIELQDSDLIKVGDQPIKISLPNIAETLAELAGLQFETKGVQDAILNVVLRNLGETGSNRILDIRTNAMVEAIVDYLGFATKRKKIKVPFTYNPLSPVTNEDSDSLAKALQEKEIDVDIEEMSEKVSYQTPLTQLLEAAAIIKSRFYKKVPGGAGLKEYLLEILKAYGKASETEGEEFDEFLDRVEKGFTNESGISDTTNPYGREYNQRPKIRQLGDEDKTS